MSELILYLIAIEIIGLAALPIAIWLFRALPDRGVAFAKPLGLLLVGYVIWLGGSFSVLLNTRASVLVVGGCLALAAWLLKGSEVRDWLRAEWRGLVRVELVFLAFFLAAAFLRAHNPAILGTEKPMDFAFLNASLRAERLPPEDPWLAGYGISYYYFGYFLLSLVIKLAGTAPAVGYNLSLALLAGLAAAGSYSVVFNLIGLLHRSRATTAPGRFAALLGPLLLLLMANLEGALEVLHNNGLLPLSFWRWLGIRDLMNPQLGPHFLPSDPPDTWWWWRASRVVGTFDPATGVASDYTINEFPFFSFLLGDLHPHVMALPFLVMVVGLALAVAAERRDVAAGADLSRPSPRLLMIGLVVGALGFLNAWDLPTGLALVVGGLVVREVSLGARLEARLVWRLLAPAGLLLAVAALAYLPFYIGLRSQAQGLGLVQVRTQVQHLVVFWGPLLFIGASYPVARLLHAPARGRTVAFCAIAALCGAALAALGAPSLGLLVALLVVFGAAVLRVAQEQTSGGEREAKSARLFVLLLGAVAVSLIALCEVVFLRDFFGNRMNTVFKLYYQAWALLALASAYTIYYAYSCRHSIARPRSARLLVGVWGSLAGVLLVASLAYTVAAPLSKAQGFSGQPTLDGLAWLRQSNPHERAAIDWLQSVPGTPTILEASGREYSQDNQASAFSGLPALLGWEGHQYQWRGRIPEPAQRKADIDTIFQTTDIAQARQLLEKYSVGYVYVGDAERRIYSQAPVGALNKFGRFMDVAYHNDRVTIYKWREAG